MANNTGVDATTVKEFCHLCLWVRRVWRSRRLVFDDNPQAVDCKYSSAPYFLNMMANWTTQQPQVVTDLKEKLARLLPGIDLKPRSGSDGSRDALSLAGLHRSALFISLH